MATLDELKEALRKSVSATLPFASRQTLSDAQYGAGFETLLYGPGQSVYPSFIIPQLMRLLEHVLKSKSVISVLEIGPGPQTVLGHLPAYMRQRIGRYSACERNISFAASLRDSLCATSDTELPLPCLQEPPQIRVERFDIGLRTTDDSNEDGLGDEQKFDIVLFCHSMYGMSPKRKFIDRALALLAGRVDGAVVIVFHRDTSLDINGLVCLHTASFPSSAVSVPDEDEHLDNFATFIAGFAPQQTDSQNATLQGWRNVCRALCDQEKSHTGHLFFGAPNIMMAFTRHATTLGELTAEVPLAEGIRVKRRRHPTAFVVRPTELSQVQKCVRWSLEHKLRVAIIGGGHSVNCLQPNIVSVDMAAFDNVDVLRMKENGEVGPSLIVAGAGCRSDTIIKKAMAAGLTVPLGSRPSVGAGLWLQGGIGHLSRLHGLACDAIVGAVMVSVESGQVLVIGTVPSQHQPNDAIRPENEADLLWALKGAGTNFGVVTSVVFKAYPAMVYSVRQWVSPLSDRQEAQQRLVDIDALARELPRQISADAYLYCDSEGLHVAVSMSECAIAGHDTESFAGSPSVMTAFLGPENSSKTVDAIGLYDTEMYISCMHGGHGGGKTSSFKRCIFLDGMGSLAVADLLISAVEDRPSPQCYLHLLHGGGAISQVAATATAFGCRNWTFACVITSVWPRDQDGSVTARAAVNWVYDVAKKLQPFSTGAYSADLGPDPRDKELAMHAFGPNRLRLSHLKRIQDPHNVLSFTCPLPQPASPQRLIVLITGDTGVGKDYCAKVLASEFTKHHEDLRVRVVSISDATKEQYAAATGADLARMLHDRAYKEEHRPALTRFFQEQLYQQPMLKEDNFLSLVHDAGDVGVLFITGMREENPVAGLSHLVAHARLIDVRVTASTETRQARRGLLGDDADTAKDGYVPTLSFDNEETGNEAARQFAERSLFPFLHSDLRRLEDMVPPIPGFPRSGICFRHVLNIVQQPGGLGLCTALLRTHFPGNWNGIDAIAGCETGGLIFASALAISVIKPLVPIRKAGKLPPPTVSADKSSSHISSASSNAAIDTRIEADEGILCKCKSVVVVDDVLATGKTLCAVLGLLNKAGVASECISVIIVAEFPVHRGRQLLRRRGFEKVAICSLLDFNGS